MSWSSAKDHVKFDRHATEPPPFLHAPLRSVGRRRRFVLEWGIVFEGKVAKFHESARRAGNMYFPRSMAYRQLGENNVGGVFVDAGCGDSADAHIATIDGFDKAYGVDLFPPSASRPWAIANWQRKVDNFYEKYPKPPFLQADLCERIPLPDNSVDVVSSSAVLDLMNDDDKILFYQEVKRILKPGGIFSVYVAWLANGYTTDIAREWSAVSMPAWGVELELVSNHTAGFVARKPGGQRQPEALSSQNGIGVSEAPLPSESKLKESDQ